MNNVFESKSNIYGPTRVGINILFFAMATFIVHSVLMGSNSLSILKQDVGSRIGNWDLSTTSGRELASIEKPVSSYTVKKCGEIKHTDGEVMTFCIARFEGTSGGFYDANRSLMVVGSFSEYTLIHEIFHAASIHNYKQGYTEILTARTQERMAYDAENLLMQIHAFKEDLNITPDLSKEKKVKSGIPVEVKLANKPLATSTVISNLTVKSSI